MSVIIERRVTPMKCHRCNWAWDYGGNNSYYASCPHCRTQLSIRKHATKNTSVTGQSLVGLGQSTEINSPNRGESAET